MSREEDRVIGSLVLLCKQLGVTCVVQVGAENGYEADAIKQATGCRAVAIDPDPRCAPCSSAIEFHEALIGATNSVVEFYLHPAPGLSGQLQRGSGGEIEVTMPQYKLSRFCRKYGITPDALIIDTEGTTLDVLEGADPLLGGVKLVYAECQTDMLKPGMRHVDDVDAFLTARGFTAHYGLPSYDCGTQGNYTWVKP